MFTWYFFIVNILLFILMGIDKKRAILNKWRVSEKNLILISLLGGSIGGLIGMYTFRHKTKHLKFTIGLPLILILQLITLYFIF